MTTKQVAFGCCFLVGSAVVDWQVFQWLKTGQWYPVTLSAALEYLKFPYPDLEWRGVQKILDFLLDFPIGLVSFIFAMFIFAAVLAMLDDLQRQRSPKSEYGDLFEQARRWHSDDRR